MSPLRWTTKSTRKLAEELTRLGHKVGADMVGDLLREEGFSLQANAKTIEGSQHPDRDTQVHYIKEQAKAHMDTGQPVISVDTKKKELVGEYKNAGREWRPTGEPVKVRTHDFLDRQGPGKAIPYGIYDIAANTGWVNVGTDHDTAAFAVASIQRWWQARGRHDYPAATRLLITADAGGSNGHRTRAWKTELAALAAETGLSVCSRILKTCRQTTRLRHRCASRAASAVGSMPARRRQAAGVEAIGPKTSAWSRSRARPAMASPPSAGITARSTAILPGLCPVPRGRRRRSASVNAAVRPVASARSASRRDPAWLTTPWPSAERTSLGRDPVVCTQKVPSCWDDRDLRQASSSQFRGHFRVSGQDPDTAASETRRLELSFSKSLMGLECCLYLWCSGRSAPMLTAPPALLLPRPGAAPGRSGR
ncbi:hypothetical protein GCM10018966_067490 [Streptomyces yanii]